MTTARQIYLGLLAALLLTLPVALRPPSATAGNCPADPACCVETNEVTCATNAVLTARLAATTYDGSVTNAAVTVSIAPIVSLDKGVKRHKRWKVGPSCPVEAPHYWNEIVDNTVTCVWSIAGGSISASGSGLWPSSNCVASITTTNAGTYTATFTFLVLGDCAPPPVAIYRNLTLSFSDSCDSAMPFSETFSDPLFLTCPNDQLMRLKYL
jgi:hypothetical protein